MSNEDAIETWLNDESDSDFGLPEIKDPLHHNADPGLSGNVANWTAENLSSAFIRFRPHLERHAKRYLRDPYQAEEVVQDAFLYLMTAAPELDSELGVLKFLKWKVRLLALDVIRAKAKNSAATDPSLMEDLASEEEFENEFAKADELAVVRMALSQLSPRHREAIIASVYQEKSGPELAKSLGLSENASRQLLFRARAAFKKALIGEAATKDLTLSEILSLAAKRAGAQARKGSTVVGALIVLAAIGIGVSGIQTAPPENVVADATDPGLNSTESLQAPIDPEESNTEPAVTAPEPVSETQIETDDTEEIAISEPVEDSTIETIVEVESNPIEYNSVETEEIEVEDSFTRPVTAIASVDLRPSMEYLGSFSDRTFGHRTSAGSNIVNIEATNSDDTKINFNWDSSAEVPFQQVRLSFKVAGETVVVYPRDIEYLSEIVASEGKIRHTAIIPTVYSVDRFGNVLDTTELASGSFILTGLSEFDLNRGLDTIRGEFSFSQGS